MAAKILPFPFGSRARPVNRRESELALKLALEALANVVDAKERGEGLQGLLAMMARLWRHSILNQWLIEGQWPGARWVAGRRAWERSGRRIREGATPIVIAAPSRRASGAVRTFWVWVYEASDTCGPPYCESCAEPAGEAAHLATLERAAARLGIAVLRADLPCGCLGRSTSEVITLRRDLSVLSECWALTHGLVSVLLRKADEVRRTTLRRPGPQRTPGETETEASAAAFVVLEALGLPSRSVDCSGWKGSSGNGVFRSWKRVSVAARRLLLATEETASKSSAGAGRRRGSTTLDQAASLRTRQL